MVSVHENAVAIPGERLGSLEQFSPGNGTYVRHGYVYASLAGYRQVQEQQNGEKSIINVIREEEKHVVPAVGSVVTCKVRFGKVFIQTNWLIRLFPVGAAMVPISWCEMQCPKTRAKEYRKVAKVQQTS
ncbi:exosome complex component CSL4-like [Orbicella faveolata]|uniref:exosome complex component CSL4-like n=1 Tax=Orbicella faveolata TaxID=48498 RepID=UPI0009E4F249|nr:exosome complex component CSL4-like [Orbicella faveolata]